MFIGFLSHSFIHYNFNSVRQTGLTSVVSFRTHFKILLSYITGIVCSHFIHNAVITIAIRLRSDYDVSCAPASNSTQAKNEHVIFFVKRIVVESQSNRNCDIGLILLCGRITRLAGPSVRPSVYPVWARNSKTRKRRKIKIGIDVPTARVNKRAASFHFQRSKVRIRVLKSF